MYILDIYKLLYFQGDKGDKGVTGTKGMKGHTGHKGDQVDKSYSINATFKPPKQRESLVGVIYIMLHWFF